MRISQEYILMLISNLIMIQINDINANLRDYWPGSHHSMQ